MGLDVYLEKEGKKIEINSKQFPEHLFKIGYFRSAYNYTGIDLVLGNNIGTSLYRLFEFYSGDHDSFFPDWSKSLSNCRNVIDEFSSLAQKQECFYSNTLLIGNDPLLETPVKILKREIKKAESGWGKDYVNSKGMFALSDSKGFLVKAIIPDMQNKCVHILTVMEDAAWYIQALKIIEETIEYVLSFPEGEIKKFYLRWSS